MTGLPSMVQSERVVGCRLVVHFRMHHGVTVSSLGRGDVDFLSKNSIQSLLEDVSHSLASVDAQPNRPEVEWVSTCQVLEDATISGGGSTARDAAGCLEAGYDV